MLKSTRKNKVRFDRLVQYKDLWLKSTGILYIHQSSDNALELSFYDLTQHQGYASFSSILSCQLHKYHHSCTVLAIYCYKCLAQSIMLFPIGMLWNVTGKVKKQTNRKLESERESCFTPYPRCFLIYSLSFCNLSTYWHFIGVELLRPILTIVSDEKNIWWLMWWIFGLGIQQFCFKPFQTIWVSLFSRANKFEYTYSICCKPVIVQTTLYSAVMLCCCTKHWPWCAICWKKTSWWRQVSHQKYEPGKQGSHYIHVFSKSPHLPYSSGLMVHKKTRCPVKTKFYMQEKWGISQP